MDFNKLILVMLYNRQNLNLIIFFYKRLKNFEESTSVYHVISLVIALPHAYTKSYDVSVK